MDVRVVPMRANPDGCKKSFRQANGKFWFRAVCDENNLFSPYTLMQKKSTSRARSLTDLGFGEGLPSGLPVEIFQTNEPLLVVINKRFLVGVTGVIVAIAALTREFD